MGYRPSEQSLDIPIRDVEGACKAFRVAATERIRNGEWASEHVAKLVDLSERMAALERDL